MKEINSIFYSKETNKIVKVIECDNCRKCVFYPDSIGLNILSCSFNNRCLPTNRNDHISVIFREVDSIFLIRYYKKCSI